MCSTTIFEDVSRLGEVEVATTSESQDAIEPILSAAGTLPNGIPILDSLPGAAASIYLDFDGHTEATWGSYSNVTAPAYDQDGNKAAFSASELLSIEKIWRHVAEDFAPFQINVTTVEPPSFANGVALRVSIGGAGGWSGGTYGGKGYVNSFSNSLPNTVWVFSANLSNGQPKYVGDAASHESGHAFGLMHQSKYDANGAKLQEYYTGPGNGAAPHMGDSYNARRSLWWYGTSTSASTFQDDLAVISNAVNGFGYRPDDHGDSAGFATSLVVSGNSVSASGIIEQVEDPDVFSFQSDPGSVTLTVTPPNAVSNLAPRIELRDSSGSTVLASALGTAGPSFSATITTTLATGGGYRLYVYSNGGYGNVGAYSVQGTILPPANLVNPPSALSAAPVSGARVDLSWVDNATNETGYRVERSSNAGATWVAIASSLSASTTAFSDLSTSAGTGYSYRVQALGLATPSDYSNIANATTAPLAPTGLSATAISSSRIDLAWQNVTGESSYSIDRSSNGGATWVAAGSVSADVVTFQSLGLSPSTTYLFRVRAVNSGGSSPHSSVASATTPSAPSVPTAPSNLLATVVSGSQIRLTWSDNSGNETGFRVERSSNGGRGWSLLAQVGANVTNYTDTTARSNKTYQYRVAAYNTAGTSAFVYSTSTSVAAPLSGPSDLSDSEEEPSVGPPASRFLEVPAEIVIVRLGLASDRPITAGRSLAKRGGISVRIGFLS